uniref:Uncharacterized protein n=1 Tax=Arundo donax TaxID=35708 RepID=A0A0A8YTN8_ARUDO
MVLLTTVQRTVAPAPKQKTGTIYSPVINQSYK